MTSNETNFPILNLLCFPGLIGYKRTADQKAALAMIQEYVKEHIKNSFFLFAVDTRMRLNAAEITKFQAEQVRKKGITPVTTCTT